MTNDERRAFVLMPFSASFDAVWDMIQEPLVEAGYQVARSDTDPSHGNIMREVLQSISKADLVIADLTGLNPNVFYELALSHALHVPTILITQSLNETPFDLRPYKVESYAMDYATAKQFQATLKELAIRSAAGSLQTGSPVIDFLPDLRSLRSSKRQQSGADPRADALEALLSTIAPLMAQTLDLFKAIVEPWQGISLAVEELSEGLATARSEEGEAGRTATQQLSSDAEAQISRLVDVLAAYVPQVTERTQRITEGSAGLSIALEAEYSDELRARLISFHRGLQSTYQAASDTLRGAGAFTQMITGMRGATDQLDDVITRATREVDALTSPLLALQSFGLRTTSILAQSLGTIEPPPESDGGGNDEVAGDGDGEGDGEGEVAGADEGETTASP
jgi:hypothetical protein